MMTNEARVTAVKERVRAREEQKRLRWIAGRLMAAAFLAGWRWGPWHSAGDEQSTSEAGTQEETT